MNSLLTSFRSFGLWSLLISFCVLYQIAQQNLKSLWCVQFQCKCSHLYRLNCRETARNSDFLHPVFGEFRETLYFQKKIWARKKDHIVKISFFTAVYKSMLMHSRINFCQEILYYWQHWTVAPPEMHWKKNIKRKRMKKS